MFDRIEVLTAKRRVKKVSGTFWHNVALSRHCLISKVLCPEFCLLARVSHQWRFIQPQIVVEVAERFGCVDWQSTSLSGVEDFSKLPESQNMWTCVEFLRCEGTQFPIITCTETQVIFPPVPQQDQKPDCTMRCSECFELAHNCSFHLECWSWDQRLRT